MKRLLLITAMIATLLCATRAQRQKPVAVRVMTFNIRTENKVDGCNNWEMRYQRVCDFIRKSKADIVGLQEVKPSQLRDLNAALTAYGRTGLPRDDGKERGEYNPIYYNQEKFNLLRAGTFWLSPSVLEPSIGWDAAYRRIASWAVLQDKATMKSVIVVNTHLDHVGSQARINSAALIKEKIGRMSNELAVIITGDMNCDETDPAYAKLLTGIFPMQDTYKAAAKVSGPAYTFHAFGQLPSEERRKIDYIFSSPQVKVKSARIYDSALGAGYYLSDHNPLCADIIF